MINPKARDRAKVAALMMAIFAVFCFNFFVATLELPRLLLLNAAGELHAGVRPGMLREEITILEAVRWTDPASLTTDGYSPRPTWDTGPIIAYDRPLGLWSFRIYAQEKDGVVQSVLLAQW